MAITYVDFTATASQTDFPFSFPYLESSHVVVEIDGVTKSLTTHYTITTSPSTKVVLISGATVGQKVRVKRDSNADSANPLVDFVNGSILNESSLDRSYLHNLYLNEEIGELNQLSLQKEVAGTDWDAKTLKVINVADPAAAQDAATKTYVDTADALKMTKAGDTMSGDLVMGTNKVTGVGDPTNTQDASTKNYVDTQISSQVTGSATAPANYAFTGDGSTAFTFSPGITLDADAMYEVAIDGVLQEPTVAYAIDADANTITFTGTPPTSSKIVVVQRGYSVPVSHGITQSDTATSVGKSALASLSSGADNVAVGYKALNAVASGNSNTAVGSNTLKVATGSTNTAVGWDSMKATTSGDSNVAHGSETLSTNISGDGNVAVGYRALKDNTANYNTALGFSAGQTNSSGTENTAVGSSALQSNSTGNKNTAIGADALTVNTASNNTAVGTDAAKANTSGAYNTAVGVGALETNITTTASTAIGYNALKLATAAGNTAVGAYALDASTTGTRNTAVGKSAGGALQDGTDNTLIGSDCATNLSSGHSNVCVGNTANALTTGTYNVTIGHGANVSAGGATNQIVLGQAIAATANDQFSLGKTSNVVSCDFGSSAAFSYASDERKKQDIKEDPLGLDFVNSLRPVTYRWKPIAQWPTEWAESKGDEVDTETVMHGMIAQDVKAALDKANVDTFSGWKERPDGQQTLALESFIMPLINAVQQLSAKVAKLEQEAK